MDQDPWSAQWPPEIFLIFAQEREITESGKGTNNIKTMGMQLQLRFVTTAVKDPMLAHDLFYSDIKRVMPCFDLMDTTATPDQVVQLRQRGETPFVMGNVVIGLIDYEVMWTELANDPRKWTDDDVLVRV